MTLPIKKGIPIPPDHRGRPMVYPWFEMKVGECFDADRVNITPPKSLTTKGWVFTKRKIADGKWRVWRKT